MTKDADCPGTPPKALITALRLLLRPLVKLMLNNRITYPYLINLLKEVFVEVAKADFKVEGKRQSDSRITLLTGVHRKDVRRFRLQGNAGEDAPGSIGLGGQLVSRWCADADYQDDNGHPSPLPRLPQDHGEPSFDSLVESVSKDIRSRAVLDEWLRLGVVHISEDDVVWLNTEAFVPEKGFEEKAYYLGKNLHDHIAACANNLEGKNAPMMERSVYYDGVTPNDIEKLVEIAKEAGMNALQTVNRNALRLSNKSSGQPDATQRINFGAYFFHGEAETSQEAQES